MPTHSLFEPATGLAILQPLIHGGGDGGAGLLGVLDSLLGALEQGVGGGSSWSPIAGITALGSNLHPMIVHFPIAFLVGFLVCEVVGVVWQRPVARIWASGMLYLGALGAVAAAVAGIIASKTVPHGAAVHEIMEWHERMGLTVAVLAVAMSGWRLLGGLPESTMAETFHLALAGIIAVCLYFGGDLGGLMVYKYGVGVQSLQLAEDAGQHQHGGDAALGMQAPAATAAAPAPAVPPGEAARPQAFMAAEPERGHSHHHHHHHH